MVVYGTASLELSNPHPLSTPLRLQMFFFPGKKTTSRFAAESFVLNLYEILRGSCLLPKFPNKKVLVLSGFADSSIKYGFEGLEGTKPKARIVVGSDRSSVRSIKISRFSFHFSGSFSLGNEKASALHFEKLSENALKWRL